MADGVHVDSGEAERALTQLAGDLAELSDAMDAVGTLLLRRALDTGPRRTGRYLDSIRATRSIAAVSLTAGVPYAGKLERRYRVLTLAATDTQTEIVNTLDTSIREIIAKNGL